MIWYIFNRLIIIQVKNGRKENNNRGCCKEGSCSEESLCDKEDLRQENNSYSLNHSRKRRFPCRWRLPDSCKRRGSSLGKRDCKGRRHQRAGSSPRCRMAHERGKDQWRLRHYLACITSTLASWRSTPQLNYTIQYAMSCTAATSFRPGERAEDDMTIVKMRFCCPSKPGGYKTSLRF